MSKRLTTKAQDLERRLIAQKILKKLIDKQGRRRKWLAAEIDVTQADYLSYAVHMSKVLGHPDRFKCPMWVIDRLIKWDAEQKA